MDLTVALAALVIFAAALGLRECPCDDANCVRAHNLHKTQERDAQALAVHRVYHGELNVAGCRHCHGPGDQ